MKHSILIAALGGWLLAAGYAQANDDALEQRSIAVTVDDLPGPPRGLVANDVASLERNTTQLLASLQRHAVPAIGFVNEGKLFLPDEGPAHVAARTAVLRKWLAAGFELGNHTYSHISLNTTPLDVFQSDVLRGEPVLRQLLAEQRRSLRYFRHPFLHVGLEADKRSAFEAWLRQRGYIVAPVTIDNDEYMYAAIYADALRRKDQATAQRIGTDYIRYMAEVFDFNEALSKRLLGREIRQVLLIHANTLNADYFDPLAEALKARGYGFVTLDQALQDEAYKRRDTYVGRYGTSWLHHWETTEGLERSPAPDPAAWVTGAYRTLEKSF